MMMVRHCSFTYAVITASSATLYVDAVKLSEDVIAHLGPEVLLMDCAHVPIIHVMISCRVCCRFYFDRMMPSSVM